MITAQTKWARNNKEYFRKRYLANKEGIDKKNMENHYTRQYGITREQKQEWLDLQSNCCAICAKELTFKTANIDHDHKSNQVRGILCNSCNQGLGLFKDEPTFLENAINYLLRRERSVN